MGFNNFRGWSGTNTAMSDTPGVETFMDPVFFFLRSHISFKALSQHYHSIKTAATVFSAADKTESSAQLLIKFILHLCLLWITETLLLLDVPKVSHCVLSPLGSAPLKCPADGNILEESGLFPVDILQKQGSVQCAVGDLSHCCCCCRLPPPCCCTASAAAL